MTIRFSKPGQTGVPAQKSRRRYWIRWPRSGNQPCESRPGSDRNVNHSDNKAFRCSRLTVFVDAKTPRDGVRVPERKRLSCATSRQRGHGCGRDCALLRGFCGDRTISGMGHNLSLPHYSAVMCICLAAADQLLPASIVSTSFCTRKASSRVASLCG